MYQLCRLGYGAIWIDNQCIIRLKNISYVRINCNLTNWFECKTGVKQGHNLSPTLFSIFVNDLVHEINNLDVGKELDKLN